MKSLEEQINELSRHHKLYYEECENWIWNETPESEWRTNEDWVGTHFWSLVDSLILNASAIQCFSSPSKYIRECKRYYEHRRKDTKDS